VDQVHKEFIWADHLLGQELVRLHDWSHVQPAGEWLARSVQITVTNQRRHGGAVMLLIAGIQLRAIIRVIQDEAVSQRSVVSHRNTVEQSHTGRSAR
jgi:hypothetical protein